MGQHLGKNSSENGNLNKNVPQSFQDVDWKAVQLLWTTFIKGESPDFIMDKHELETLFESWQKAGKSDPDIAEDSWFENNNYFLGFLKRNKLSTFYAKGSYYYLALKFFHVSDLNFRLIICYTKLFVNFLINVFKKIVK